LAATAEAAERVRVGAADRVRVGAGRCCCPNTGAESDSSADQYFRDHSAVLSRHVILFPRDETDTGHSCRGVRIRTVPDLDSLHKQGAEDIDSSHLTKSIAVTTAGSSGSSPSARILRARFHPRWFGRKPVTSVPALPEARGGLPDFAVPHVCAGQSLAAALLELVDNVHCHSSAALSRAETPERVITPIAQIVWAATYLVSRHANGCKVIGAYH
jgi:hypothetical protein